MTEETVSKQECPMCGDEALYKTVRSPLHGKRFTCPTCLVFFIDSYGESEISNWPTGVAKDRKLKLQKWTQDCQGDKLLVIREPLDEEIRGNGHGIARDKLIVEYISRA